MKQLTTGMCLDELPVEQREGSWRKAKNILVYKRGNAITNENGDVIVHSKSVMVHVDLKTKSKRVIPLEIKQKIAAYDNNPDIIK